ncbi:MAG: acyl-CoA thioesterase [Candidatus Sumerlaeia bacterium]
MLEAKKSGRNVGPLAEGTCRIRVSYRDTDQMGHVYYANYLVYFEIARTELLRELGRTYKDCEADGIFLPVAEANCQYREPVKYDDLIEITTRVTKWTKVALDFHYEIRRAGEEPILASGITRHAFTSREGKIIRAGDRVLK